MSPEADKEGDVAMHDAASALSSSKENPKYSLEVLNKALESHAESDAQTIITDFLDFTDYLPSDAVRSLTLIGKLDETYTDASIRLNELTTTWGKLPTLPASARPSPAKLRKEISESLEQSVSSRVFAHAEAVRMSENVNRHYNKANILLEKLQSMMDNYPTEEQQAKSPIISRSPQMSRAKPSGPGAPKVQRRRIPRITVPGEVLAPYDIEYANFTDDSESSDDLSDAPPQRRTPGPAQRIKIVSNKPKNSGRAPKQVPSSDFMSAAHAANQAALRRPPPPDAVIGSADAPWLQLTDYELAKLRKRMKKNATWTPSETMIARELKALGRGPDAYREAKKQAENEGVAFESKVPSLVVDDQSGSQQLPVGALSEDFDAEASNRGMKLNEAKKIKREALAKLAAEEAEDAARKMAETAKILLGPNGKPEQAQEDINKTARAASRPANNKRKRDDEDGATSASIEEGESSAAALKRTKVETPVLPPKHISLAHTTAARETPVPPPLLTPGGTATLPPVQTPVPIPIPPLSSGRGPATSPIPSNATTVTTTAAVKPPAETPVPLPRKASITPVHPPIPPSTTRETRGDAAKRTQQGQSLNVPATQTSPQSVSPSRGPSPRTTPVPESASRPQSRGQPSLAADRPRRASTTRNTPAPESSAPVKKRPPRPAPGVVSTTNSGGNSAVGKRKAPPKKKSSKKLKGQVIETEIEEVDDEGNPIDPDEPRYCLCNRVSFGTMIQCDNPDVRNKFLNRSLLKSLVGLAAFSEPVKSKSSFLPSGQSASLAPRSSSRIKTLKQKKNREKEMHRAAESKQQYQNVTKKLTKMQNCKQEWFHLECVGLEAIPARTTKWFCPDCRKKLGLGEKGEVSARGVRK